MCRWLSYSGAPIFLEKLLFEPEFSLIAQSLHARKATVATNGDGFGVGWYGERPVPGLYRDILPAWADPNLKSLAHQIRAKMFFAHVRASTGTATSRANCHPFAQGRWLFMHNGQIGGYDRIRRRLDALIPDELYPRRGGTTDSELIFLALFGFGLETDPAGALRRTAAAIGEAMADAAIDEPFRMTAALSDGCSVWTVRYATDETPPSLFYCADDGQRLIVSEPLDGEFSQWHQVPPGHLLVTDCAGRLDLEPFRP
ncbi:class II glutamine amidotransferase [Mycobacterium sp. KBS0706]|uniref:class II glutamine amidotransferase n=1 Tax=Mycobacterium sp. KBS0706 TaxID=2578109 RepID=UPI00110FD222|nr:class II glutamine amidotransferase [Mycobacterium sp. KBS0706]TSD86897.1 class II glutamine amidotransferase [Mycobacterium sp. KBS0706]